MKRMILNSIVILMALTMFVILLNSCGESGTKNIAEKAGITSGGDNINDIDIIANSATDDLPELDYNGYEFNILTRENFTFYNYLVQEETGEILNDAVYRRTRNVEDRLNILLNEVTTTDANAPRPLMLSGDNSFDFYNARCTHALTFWVEGLTLTIDDLPYINLEKNYWNKTANNSISIKNKQYVAIGAANIGACDFIFTLLFNKAMLTDLGIDLPYDLVNSGKWTIDKMDEMMKMAVSDVNGDGEWTDEDIYGYVSSSSAPLPGFWIGSGLYSVAKDSDDIPYLSVGEQKFIQLMERVFEITWDTNAWYKTTDNTNVPDSSIKLFTNNKSMFMDVQIFYLNQLRSMETDFGVIPYPKFDDEQNEYHSRGGFYDAFIVSKSNEDLDRTSAVIEALNSESYITVYPDYYDRCLKTRNSRDNDSEAMLDLIFNNLVIDLGDTVWTGLLRDGVLNTMFKTNDRNITSKMESIKNSVQAEIDKILE